MVAASGGYSSDLPAGLYEVSDGVSSTYVWWVDDTHYYAEDLIESEMVAHELRNDTTVAKWMSGNIVDLVAAGYSDKEIAALTDEELDEATANIGYGTRPEIIEVGSDPIAPHPALMAQKWLNIETEFDDAQRTYTFGDAQRTYTADAAPSSLTYKDGTKFDVVYDKALGADLDLGELVPGCASLSDHSKMIEAKFPSPDCR